MAVEELKKDLEKALDGAESVGTLDPMKRGALKSKLMNLPEMQMRQVLEQLKDEEQKLAEERAVTSDLISEAKNESRTLHSLMLQEQRKGESVESEESSDEILGSLEKVIKPEKARKSHYLRVGLAAVALAIVVSLIIYYWNII